MADDLQLWNDGEDEIRRRGRFRGYDVRVIGEDGNPIDCIAFAERITGLGKAGMVPSIIVTGGLFLLRRRDNALMGAGLFAIGGGLVGFPADPVALVYPNSLTHITQTAHAYRSRGLARSKVTGPIGPSVCWYRGNKEANMNLNDLLPDGGINALAAQLGIPREQAQRGAEVLLPSVLGGMGNNTAQLDAHVNTLGGAELASNVLGNEPTQIDAGNQILGGIFGSKDGSREVADNAAQSSGLAPELLKQMLPILVMLVAGHLTGRSVGQQGGLPGIIGSVLGSLGGAGVAGAAPGGGLGGGLGGILGSVFGDRR